MDRMLPLNDEITSKVTEPNDSVHSMNRVVPQDDNFLREKQRKVRRRHSAPELSHLRPETDDYSQLDDNEQSALQGLENAIATAKHRTYASTTHRDSEPDDMSYGSVFEIRQSSQDAPGRHSRAGREPKSRSDMGGRFRTTNKTMQLRPMSEQTEDQTHSHENESMAKTDLRNDASSSKIIADNMVVNSTVVTSTATETAVNRLTATDASNLRRGLEPDSLMRLANSSLVQRGLDPATTSTIVTGVVSAIVGAGGTAAGAATWWLAYKSRQRNKQERDIELQEIGDRLADETKARRRLDLELKNLSEQVKRQQRDVEQRQIELDRRARFLHTRAGQLESEALEHKNRMTFETNRARDSRARHLERWAAELEELEITMEDRQQKLDEKETRLRRKDLKNHYAKAVMAEIVVAQREKCVKKEAKAWQVEFKKQTDLIKESQFRLREGQTRFERECQQLAQVEQSWIVAVEQLQTQFADLTHREEQWQLELQESKVKIAAQQLELELLRNQLKDRSEIAFDGSHTGEQSPPPGNEQVAGLQPLSKSSNILSSREQTSVVSRCPSQMRQEADLKQRWENFHRKS